MILQPDDIIQKGDVLHYGDGSGDTLIIDAYAGALVWDMETLNGYVERPGPAPDWERAYTTLYATNEQHISELETANTIISALQTKVDNLRRVIKRAQTPICPTCEMDDDALEPV